MDHVSRVSLTLEQALAALPDGARVHTFMDGGAALIGADWDRAKIEAALRGARIIFVTGPQAQRVKHGMAIAHPDRSQRPLYIETRDRTDGDDAGVLRPEMIADATDAIQAGKPSGQSLTP